MFDDHHASRTGDRRLLVINDEALGHNRGYRDAMIEVMSWVTGRDTDEILAELHDQVVDLTDAIKAANLTGTLTLGNPIPVSALEGDA